MQGLSYRYPHPRFSVADHEFSVTIHTFENIYGLDRRACQTALAGDTWRLRCDRLTYAGGQLGALGFVSVTARMERSRLFVDIESTAPHDIRAVKLTLHRVPRGTIEGLREAASLVIPPHGLVLHYPDGWRELATPLVFLRSPQGLISLRSLDERVRAKRFAFVPRGRTVDVELIFESLGVERGRSVRVPTWEIDYPQETTEVVERQRALIERAYGLRSWEERDDVPAWMRDVSLVVTLHGQHWTGYIFNTYGDMLEALRWVAHRLDGHRILAYLPGWEGRYYWDYGDYEPDPRMGGEDGLRRLVDGAHALGIRVMPMFGINVANRAAPGFERWGAPAVARTVGGISGGPTVDWDEGRHHDHGWAATLNPGALTWQRYLVGTIDRLVRRFAFDAVFLDISAGWHNDASFEVFAGVRDLVASIRAAHPDLLVAGEGWYDAMAAITPLCQAGCAMPAVFEGHASVAQVWHDAGTIDLFSKYCRAFGHLTLGDPSRGSTGTHELGRNRVRLVPFRRAVLPTLPIVDCTIVAAPAACERTIEQAAQYAAEFLASPRPTVGIGT
jgi:hypothetical protein